LIALFTSDFADQVVNGRKRLPQLQYGVDIADNSAHQTVNVHDGKFTLDGARNKAIYYEVVYR
jgi:hypothetical protein